jgi:LysM repeat protein
MFRLVCSAVVFIIFSTNAFGTTLDSLGVNRRNGQVLVQHKVEKGETLYAILKRYNCAEKDFLAANPTFKKEGPITPKQIIEIPFANKKSTEKAPIVEIIPTQKQSDKKNIDENGIEIVDVPEATPKEIKRTEKITKTDSSKEVLVKKNIPLKTPLKGKTHTVLAGQNLFTVAKLYNVKVFQIKEWNNLSNDALSINQILLVEKPANFVDKPTKKDTLKSKTLLIQGPAGDVGKEKEQPIVNKVINNQPPTVVPNAPGGKKFSEQGIAEIIEAGATTNKFLALHRTAPVGTLIKVANQANGQSVWVKVIGKLNVSGDVIIKISPKAFEKLSPKDKRIRADLSYSISN